MRPSTCWWRTSRRARRCRRASACPGAGLSRRARRSRGIARRCMRLERRAPREGVFVAISAGTGSGCAAARRLRPWGRMPPRVRHRPLSAAYDHCGFVAAVAGCKLPVAIDCFAAPRSRCAAHPFNESGPHVSTEFYVVTGCAAIVVLAFVWLRRASKGHGDRPWRDDEEQQQNWPE